MPNINSSDYKLDLKRKIESSCCSPISAANIMIYLAKHSCCRLVPPMHNLSEDHFISKLIETLAKLMYTTSIGTYPSDLINGLNKYVKDRGYKISIKSAGWIHGERYKDKNHPFPEWVMQGMLGSFNSILNFGNYEYNSKKDLFKRKEGHSVTGVGFIKNWNELLVHDCVSFKQLPVHYQMFKLKDIKLNSVDYSIPASKYYWLEECDSCGESCRNDYKTSIQVLDGVLSFEVTPK